MKVVNCPKCGGRSQVKNWRYNDSKEYKHQYLYCDRCDHDYGIYIFGSDRGKELLNYEKAYWKMKELLDQYF